LAYFPENLKLSNHYKVYQHLERVATLPCEILTSESLQWR